MKDVKRTLHSGLQVIYMVCMVLGVAGCSPNPSANSVNDNEFNETFFLTLPGSGDSETIRKRFLDLFPAAQTGPVKQISENPNLLSIIAEPENITLDEWRIIDQTFASGNDILLFGENPLGITSRIQYGVMIDEQSPEQADESRLIASMTDVPLWKPASLNKRIYSEVREVRIPGSALPVYSLHLRYSTAPLYLTSDFTEAQDIESFSIYARSDTQIPWTLSLGTDEGVLFSAQINPKPEWQSFTYSPQAFRETGTENRLDSFSSVTTIQIGQDPTVITGPYEDASLEFTPPLRGEYEEAVEPVFSFLDQDSTSTSLLTERSWRAGSPEDQEELRVRIPVDRIHSPDWTHITLLKGSDAQGNPVPVLSQFYKRDGSGGRILWCGVDLNILDASDLIEVVRTAVKQSEGSSRLIEAYLSQPAIPEQTSVTLNYSILTEPQSKDPVVIQATMLHPEGRIMGHPVREVLQPPFEERMFKGTLIIPGFAQNDQRLRDYTIRTTLQEGTGTLNTLDERSLTLKVFASPPDIDSRFFLKANGTLLRLGRNGLFLNAVDYTPLVSKKDQRIDWLDPSVFPGTLIQRDLGLIREAGFNCIRIQLPGFTSPFSLRSLSEELIRNGLLGILKLPDLPLSALQDQLPNFIADSDINNMPHWVAIELNGNQIHKDMVSHAEKDWAYWWNSKDLSAPPVTPPFDKGQWIVDEQSPDAELYRAFANDMAAQRISAVKSILRENDLNQMITLETSPLQTNRSDVNGGFPFDFRAGHSLVDFVMLSEFYTDPSFRDDPSHSLELAKLARGLVGGSPLVWSGIHASLGAVETEAMMKDQEATHRKHVERIGTSWAAGSVVERYKDVDPLQKKGIWSMNISPRPAVEVYTDKSNQYRTQRQTPIPWRDARFSGNPKSGSLNTLLKNLPANIRPKEEIRHEFYNIPTTLMEATRIGSPDYGPFENVNALWENIVFDSRVYFPIPSEPIVITGRKPLTLTVLNNGQSEWTESKDGLINSVWIEVLHEDYDPRYLPVESLSSTRSQALEWFPHAYGQFRIRPYLWGKGPFGHMLTVHIQPPEESN